MQPLAYRLRPKTFDDIIGQDHLVGINGIIRKMINQNKVYSMILYGVPGCGKTSIAKIIAASFSLNVFEFNASVDNKQKLKEITESSAYFETTILIIDEIHRMKKDVQDFLLPSMENGKITVIGLTTENPYHSVNPAIRSRSHIYRLNHINNEDIKKLLTNVINNNDEFKDYVLSNEIIDYIAISSGSEVRTALNMLEIITLSEDKNITLDQVIQIIGKPNLTLDKNSDNYYECLSALQKSIRGSDVNASIHYLARLLTAGDLEIIFRRLLAIAYEDIGLGNPQIGPRLDAAINAAKQLGMPEARIPLSVIVVDMALSPKSNSAYSAINEALSDYQSGKCGPLPKHIINREILKNPKLYKYPHDFNDSIVKQQYLPDNMINKQYYLPKTTGKYERAFKERLEYLNKILK